MKKGPKTTGDVSRGEEKKQIKIKKLWKGGVFSMGSGGRDERKGVLEEEDPIAATPGLENGRVWVGKGFFGLFTRITRQNTWKGSKKAQPELKTSLIMKLSSRGRKGGERKHEGKNLEPLKYFFHSLAGDRKEI